MAVFPVEPIRRKLGEWLALAVAVVALVTTLCSIVIFAYTVGKWQALSEVRIESLEKYTIKHEDVVKEQIQIRTAQISELRGIQNELEKDQEQSRIAIDRLQNQTSALQASQTQITESLRDATKALNILVTKLEVTTTLVQQLQGTLETQGDSRGNNR